MNGITVNSEKQHPFFSAVRDSGVGVQIVYLPEVASTNTYALELSRKNAENGTVVITDLQTMGRGRGENKWEAVAGRGLTFSVILYPHLPVSYTSFTSLLAGVAVSEALDHFAISTTLKWPNDIYCNNGKLGGILCESHVLNARLESIIIGIGLNVNEKPKQFSPQIRSKAVSLYTVVGKEFDRAELFKEILASIDAWVKKWSSGSTGEIVEAWTAKCNHLGHHVKFKSGSQWAEGVFKGISEHGEAILENRSGIQLYSGSDLYLI